MSYMEQYQHLQQFKSVKEFDQYRSNIFYKIKDKLSKGTLSVWNVLAQHSCEVVGVCWIQINKIAKLAGVSRSTVERAIRLFKKLGVINVAETTRPVKGGDGANIYIFQNLGEGAGMKGREESQNPCPAKADKLDFEKETNISKSLNKNNNHLNIKRSSYIKLVPKSLQHFQAYFGKHVKTLYGRVWLAAKNLGIKADQEIMQSIGFTALEKLKQYAKDGKQLTPEEQCKCAYKIAYNQLEQRFGQSGEILDWGYEADRFFELIKRKKQ